MQGHIHGSGRFRPSIWREGEGGGAPFSHVSLNFKVATILHLGLFLKIFYCISSDFSGLPDMTDEYIDLSVYALTGWLLYVLYLTYIQK